MFLGVDPTLIDKIQDPYFLDEIAQTFKDVSTSAELYGPWAGPWVGESGGAYNSGGKSVSHAFVNGFWYVYNSNHLLHASNSSVLHFQL